MLLNQGRRTLYWVSLSYWESVTGGILSVYVKFTICYFVQKGQKHMAGNSARIGRSFWWHCLVYFIAHFVANHMMRKDRHLKPNIYSQDNYIFYVSLFKIIKDSVSSLIVWFASVIGKITIKTLIHDRNWVKISHIFKHVSFFCYQKMEWWIKCFINEYSI